VTLRRDRGEVSLNCTTRETQPVHYDVNIRDPRVTLRRGEDMFLVTPNIVTTRQGSLARCVQKLTILSRHVLLQTSKIPIYGVEFQIPRVGI